MKTACPDFFYRDGRVENWLCGFLTFEIIYQFHASLKFLINDNDSLVISFDIPNFK